MSYTIDERLPEGSTSLWTHFAVPGALVGLALWWLGTSLQETEGGRAEAATMLAIGLSANLYFLTVFKNQAIRAALGSALLGVVLSGLYWLAEPNLLASFVTMVGLVMVNALIAVVALPFLRAALRDRRVDDYRPLFCDAWNLPVIVSVSLAFSALSYGLAWLVAALFAFIGFEGLRAILGEARFVVPFLTMVYAIGIHVVRQRGAAVLAARGLVMALLRVIAPVFTACVAVFVLAVMLRGFNSLIGDVSPVATMVFAALFSIVLINAIVGEAGQPENTLFGVTARLLCVLLVLLMSLAVYGLFLRIQAEGWTLPRIGALIATLVTALYALIYAAAGLSEKWGILRRGNVAMSAVLVIVAVFVQTPFFRPLEWSTASQVAIIEGDLDAVTEEDLTYLRARLGQPGAAAFERLTAAHPRLATLAEALAATDGSPYGARLRRRVAKALASGTLRVYPSTGALSIDAYEHIGRWLTPSAERTVVVMDDDLAVFWLVEAQGGVNVRRIIINDGASGVVSNVTLDLPPSEHAALFDRLAQEGLTFETRVYRVPVIGSVPINATPKQLAPYEVSPLLAVPPDGAGVTADAP